MNNLKLLLKFAPLVIQIIAIIRDLVQNVSDKLIMQDKGQATPKEDRNIQIAAKRLAGIGADFLPDAVKAKASRAELEALAEKLEPAAFAVVDVLEAIAPLLKS